MSANPFANKPFLINTMTQLLAYGSNNSFVGTVTQSGTTLTIVSTTSGTVGVGSLISITGFLPVSVYSGSGSTWTVNLSQTVSTATAATATAYTVQNTLDTFLNGVNATNYALLESAIQGAQNAITNNSYGTSPNSNLRVLIASDDGSVVIDTSKTTNQYVNYNNKIKIASGTVNSSNQVTVDGTSPPTAIATLTIGTAGGNNINENHMSRPEILLACLSNSGIGFSQRYSSSISSFNYYLCQRIGLSTEQPVGYIRLSVPEVV
jgi:hypothetical protein